MLTRRFVTSLPSAALAMIAAPPLLRPAQAQAQTQAQTPVQAGPVAVAFVKSTSDRLVAIANSTGSPQDKHRRLQNVIDATVDVDDIAHFCLGRFGRLATPDQMRHYLGLFDTLLVTRIAGHLGEYRGVQVTMGLARPAEDTEIVVTRVERSDNPAYQIGWVVSTATGGPKIIDLLAGGTSLRQTQGSDFASYLARHQYNIHELLDGMQQLIAQGGAAQAS